MSSILNGYTSQQTAYRVDDYPYGYRLRTSIFYWVESKPGKGDRFCTYTIDPRTGKANKPKCSTYSTLIYMHLNEDNHVKYGIIDCYHMDQFPARFEFLLNKVGEQYLSEVQKDNLRMNFAQHFKIGATYRAGEYTEQSRPAFIQWAGKTLKHIISCDFKDLCNFPAAPTPDIKKEGDQLVSLNEYADC